MTVGTRVQLRNDTAANWTSANPTLLAGEAGIETDTGKFKLGNGSSAWTALSYAGGGGASTPLTTTATKTANYTAAANERVPVDTTSGAVTVTLPTAPADGTVVEVGHIIQGSTNVVTISRGGSSDVFNKAGGSTSVSLSLVNQKMYFTYIASLGVWWVRDALSLAALDARYPQTSQVAPLTNATPQTASTIAGSAGTASEAMRADAVIPLPSGLGSSGLFGSSAQDLVFDGTTTVSISNPLTNVGAVTYAPSGNVYTVNVPAPIIGRNITINSGVTVKFQGANSYARVFSSGTLTNNGTIQADGLAASSASGATSPFTNIAGSGGSGATGVGGASSAPGTPLFGGKGGVGGTGSSGAGGATGNTDPGSPFSMTVAVLPDAVSGHIISAGQVLRWTTGSGGGGGAGDGTNSGGGGGTAGGGLIVNAKTIINNGVISAKGGNGFTPTTGNCGGGGGGGGGAIVLNTGKAVTGSGSITVAAGSAGAGVGTGAAGSAGGVGAIVTNVWA